jgi:hypothetical protein
VLSRSACSGSLAHRVRAAGIKSSKARGSRGKLCGKNRDARVACAICHKPILLCERPR